MADELGDSELDNRTYILPIDTDIRRLCRGRDGGMGDCHDHRECCRIIEPRAQRNVPAASRSPRSIDLIVERICLAWSDGLVAGDVVARPAVCRRLQSVCVGCAVAIVFALFGDHNHLDCPIAISCATQLMLSHY